MRGRARARFASALAGLRQARAPGVEGQAVVDLVAPDGQLRRASSHCTAFRRSSASSSSAPGPSEIGVLGPDGLGVVVGEHRRVLVARLALALEPVREGGVQLRPPRLRQARVGDLARERVLDHVLALAGDRGAGAAADEVALLEQPEVRLSALEQLVRPGRSRRRARSPRRPAAPPSRPGGSRSMRAASTACTESGISNPAGSSPTPAAVRRASTPRSIRVATSSSTKNGFPSARSTTASRTGVGQLDAEQLVEPGRPRLRLGQRLEPEQRRVARRRPSRVGGRAARAAPSRAAAAARSPARPARRAGREVVLRPVQVLDQHHGRPLGDELLEELDPRVVQPLAGGERVQTRRTSSPSVEAEDLAPAEPLERRSGGSLSRIPKCSLSTSAKRPVGDALPVREAAAGAPQRRGRLRPASHSQSSRTSRVFPTPASPRIVTSCGSPPLDDAPIRSLELLELALAADEGASQPADPARAHQRQRAHEPPARDAARLPLRLDRHAARRTRTRRARRRPCARRRGSRPARRPARAARRR